MSDVDRYIYSKPINWLNRGGVILIVVGFINFNWQKDEFGNPHEASQDLGTAMMVIGLLICLGVLVIRLTGVAGESALNKIRKKD
jgi:hypothetical protein